jgi:hypothetical protein
MTGSPYFRRSIAFARYRLSVDAIVRDYFT